MIKAGTFDDKSNDGSNKTIAARASVGTNPTKQKGGTANTVIKEEDNGEETGVKEDKMPTQEHLLQMLGMSNTLIGNVNNTEEPAAKSEGCWDGVTLTHLGFTNLQVEDTGCDTNHDNQDQGVSFAETEWKVQGVRGTNPLKVKKKIKTTLKSSDAAHASTIKMDEKPALVKTCTKDLN